MSVARRDGLSEKPFLLCLLLDVRLPYGDGHLWIVLEG